MACPELIQHVAIGKIVDDERMWVSSGIVRIIEGDSCRIHRSKPFPRSPYWNILASHKYVGIGKQTKITTDSSLISCNFHKTK